MGKKATTKRLKAELKSLKSAQSALLYLGILANAEIEELKERHHSLKNAISDHLDTIREDQRFAYDRGTNTLRSLNLTDEVLEDVVKYLKSLPKFQGGPTHPFKGKQNDDEEAQDRSDSPHPLN